MSTVYVSINGQLTPADQASLKVGDLSVQRGYGIFDFFKTLEGRPVFLEAHLDRFFRSAEAMRLPLSMGREGLLTMIEELMKANAIPDSGVRLTLTGGYSPDGYTLAAPNLVITQQPLIINTAALSKGIRLITYEHVRQMPEVKTIDYLMAIWLQPRIKAHNADDVLYQKEGIVTECPRSNFFMVTAEGKVATPKKNILQGVTRGKLLELGKGSLAIEERDISLEDIRSAKEAFITSTTKYLLPVTAVNGHPVGNGNPGPVTAQLLELLQMATQTYIKSL